MLNLQDLFLNQVRKEQIPVTIYLTNGFQFRGMVKGFDNFTIFLESEGRQNMVYKNAVSTICPLRPVRLLEPPVPGAPGSDKAAPSADGDLRPSGAVSRPEGAQKE